MPNYRRARAAGATYFFTVALANRGGDTLTQHIDTLRAAFVATWRDRPFTCDAFVVLPDHLHAVWTLPPGDRDFSTRWRLLKGRFSHGVGSAAPRSHSKARRREAGLWQRRFWEHLIRDEADYAMHVGYCLSDPVKHGWVTQPAQWPYSSIHRDIRSGRMSAAWAGVEIEGNFGE